MIIIWQIVFWASILLILNSYVFFPVLLSLLAKNKTNPEIKYSIQDDLPKVSILMSIFNEESVIAEKIESILATDYPLNKVEIIIGSDCSSDKSNEIVQNYSQKYSLIRFVIFYERQGKPNVINQIFDLAKGEIIILTDANVIFEKQTIFELVKFFKDSSIGLVDSQMVNRGLVQDGISIQESSYIAREVSIKSKESKIWGTMMGPFGGCYAIRKNLYKKVPKNYLVDDFYINMKILEQGYKSINNTQAIVYEDVSNNIKDEFRRKRRIATGNFQNLKSFKHFLIVGLGFRPKKIVYKKNYSLFGLSFCFFSHKVNRWIVPFLLFFIAISGFFLINLKFYLIAYICFVGLLILPFLDFFLKKIKIHISLLRFITHFLTMNLALFIGFFRFVLGVKSGIWKPTKRNQTENKN